MHRNKVYVGIMRVHKEIGENELMSVVNKFIGKISQVPPKRSSVKRAVREREIVYFKLLEIEDKDILFETEVQAGTYIRKLCDDMGKDIGGAHMLELRRIKAGTFSEKDSSTLYDFDKALEEYRKGNDQHIREMLIPAEMIANILPVIKIKKQVLKKVLAGSPIFEKFLSKSESKLDLEEGMKVCVFCESTFVGCYNYIAKGDLIAKPEFVFN